MRIAVFTTSYPRSSEDFAGRFVEGQVIRLRQQGHIVDVVGPGAYQDFGLCYGDGRGLMGSIRQKPWLAVPLFISMVIALRKAAKDADLVHAHWLAGALVARFTHRPFVVTLHGSGTAGRFSDLALMARYPALVRYLLRPARTVICVGQPLADAAQGIGIAATVLRNGVELSARPREPLSPPFALFVGRLAPEKGIADLVEATAGLSVVVCGDGPLRGTLPPEIDAKMRPHSEVVSLYHKAACLIVSSYEEGSPTVIIEAMACGCPVVTTAVADAPYVVADGETGYVVPIGDTEALRSRVQQLLADPALCERLGRAARDRIAELCGWDETIARLSAIYEAAIV